MFLQDIEDIARQWSFHNMKDQLKQYVIQRSEEAFKRGDEARDSIKTLNRLKLVG